MPAKNEVRLLALTEEGKENMDAVCKLLTDQNIRNTWICQSDALSVEIFEEDVIYVSDPTSGKEVDHLINKGFSVIGPQCALTVLKHNILLKNDLKYPVYNLTMLGCLICFSNIEPKKRVDLTCKVERMGGKVSGLLTQDVSHLVVKEVGSVKYFSAAHAGISIMTMEWIEYLWKNGQSKYVSAIDGKWEEFKCPIFLGCSVCVTGFGTNERNRIQKLVTKFGGIYSGAMKLDFTTHLVVHKPEGQKYMMANKFGVKVVSVDWVYKSVEKGSCQDHSKFPVRVSASTAQPSKPHSSTPERNDTQSRVPSIQDMSNISVLAVNETVAPADMSTLSSIYVPPAPKNGEKYDLLNFPIKDSYDQVLDGISVYLVGFGLKEDEKLRQLLSISGATRYNQLTSSVTHVIAGPPSAISASCVKAIQAVLHQPDRELWVVSCKWLLDSLRKSEILSEFDYWKSDIAVRSERSGNGEVFDDADQTTLVEQKTITQIENRESTFRDDADTKPNMSGMHDVLSQYVGPGQETDHEGDTTLLRNFQMKEDAPMGPPNETTSKMDETSCASHPNDETSQENTTRWSFFREKSFIIFGFDEDELNKCVDNIESLEGRILPSHSKRIADYAVVPLTGWQVERTVENIVTNFWIDLCVNEGCVVETSSHPMCTPFLIPNNATPLVGCVTSLSKYLEPERSHLVHLMLELGATYQDNVARKDMPPMRRTTHLVVMVPEGDKYVGCLKWGIHTVTSDWVFECARQGKKMPESDFLVDKTEPAHKKADFDRSVIAGVGSKRKMSETSPTRADVSVAPSKLKFPPMPRPPSAVDHIRRRLEAKAEAQRLKEQETPLREKVLRNVGTPGNFMKPGAKPKICFDLDDVFAMLKTPAHERSKVRGALQRPLAPEEQETPFREKVLRNIETPSNFMKPGSNPNFSFDLDEVFALLKTPVHLQDKVMKSLSHSAKSTGPDVGQPQPEQCEELDSDIVANLEKDFDKVSSDEEQTFPKDAAPEKTFTNNSIKETMNPIGPETNAEPEMNKPVAEPSLPLKGLVLYVCKKLTKQRMELSDVINELGGEFRWTYDTTCTHFIFQGKQNDTNREFRSARSDGKVIVSPHWITACKETGCRLGESDFPHVYNPNKSIQVLQSFSQPRTRRRTTRNSVPVDESACRSTRTTSSNEDEVKKASTRTTEANHSQASQEARDSLKKTLETIMSSTSKMSKGRSTRLSSSREAGRFSSPPHLLPIPPRSSTGNKSKNSSTESDIPESSQDAHVVWDDPIGREEMERIMKEKAEKSDPAPTAEKLAETPSNNTDLPAPSLPHKEETVSEHDENSSNPQHVQTSVESDDRLSQLIREGKQPAFLISAVTPEQKTEYAAVIESLGGRYLDRDYFDPVCTHLIVRKPARNEKFLASLSSGKWILHTSYIEACKEAGSFVKEDPHEFGNPTATWGPANDAQAALIHAAYRWRCLLNQRRSKGESPVGAFAKWNVILHVSDRHTPGFVRLLQSGSGRVVARSLPYQGSIDEVTHAIIDPTRIKTLPWREIEVLHEAGVHCCVSEYIAEFLMKDPQPNVEDLYLPGIKAMLESEGTPRKRRKLN